MWGRTAKPWHAVMFMKRWESYRWIAEDERPDSSKHWDEQVYRITPHKKKISEVSNNNETARTELTKLCFYKARL